MAPQQMIFLLRRHSATFVLILCCLLLVTAQAKPPSVNTSVWHLQHPDGRELHILGSLHMLPDEAYPLPATMTRVINSAKHVVFENNLSTIDPRKVSQFLATHGYFAKGKSLSQVLTKKQYQQAQRYAELVAYPLSNFNRTLPWLLALQLQLHSIQQAKFRVANGIDIYIHAYAKLKSLPVTGLEPHLTPFKALAALPLSEQLSFLKGVVRKEAGNQKELNRIYHAWRLGQQQLLADYLLDDTMAVFRESMLLQRNRQWATVIDREFSHQRDGLVVVGVAHLVGPSNLLHILQSYGFEVTQL